MVRMGSNPSDEAVQGVEKGVRTLIRQYITRSNIQLMGHFR